MAAAFGGETRLLAVFGRFAVSYVAGSGIIISEVGEGKGMADDDSHVHVRKRQLPEG